MSEVSVSGVLTLVALIAIGPIVYASEWIWRKKKSTSTEEAPEEAAYGADAFPVKDDPNEQDLLTSNQYLFSLLGYAIGIGNVWRFPYVIAQNGGAAALVAYLICLVLVASPLYLYEMIVGQYVGKPTMECYRTIHPRWWSLGIASGIMLFLVLTYYALIVAYTLIYIVGACQEPLPWKGDSAGYWNMDVLRFPDDIESFDGLGGILGHLAGALAVMWLLIGLSTAFGKEVLSKITYVTVIMPLALMTILVIRSAFLPGAGDGIAFYIGKFDASKLGDLSVWSTACSQILFSLSPGFGTAITYSAVTKPKEDVYRTCMITCLCNSAFSIFSGFGIFAIVGNLAYELGEPVEEVAVRGGMGLAFITIAEAMTFFGSASNAMSVLFFVTLLTLGLDSAYAWLETLVAYGQLFFVEMGYGRRPVWQVTVGLIVIMYLLGLMYCTPMGLVLLDVVDHYVGILFLLVICFFEGVMFNLDVKWERLSLALKKATYGNPRTPKGRTIFPSWICKLDFFVTVPILTGGLGLYTFINDIREPYGGYPTEYTILGWVFFGILMGMVPLTLFRKGPSTLKSIEELREEVEAVVAKVDGYGDPTIEVTKGEKTTEEVVEAPLPKDTEEEVAPEEEDESAFTMEA